MTPGSDLGKPTAARRNSVWLLELIPLGLGIFLGREVAYQRAFPGTNSGASLRSR